MFKTIKAALASVESETKCTVCGNPACRGFTDVSRGVACVARIHDAYAMGVRARLIRSWGKRPRITGVPGAGILDAKMARK